MKLLDRYILKNFLATFFFTVIIFVLVVCLVDFTENHDDFLKHQVPYSEIFGVYYKNYFPYIANMLSPILIFISTVIVTARLAARTEIIAMFNSGMSFLRILVPYVIGAALISALTFYLIGWVIPTSNKARIDFENEYLHGKVFIDAQDVHMKIAPETFLYMKSYNGQIKTGYDFTLETIRDNDLLSKLKTNKISWNEEKNLWHIREYSVRKIIDGKEFLSQGTNLDTVLAITPADLDISSFFYETLTMHELENFIDKLKERGSEEVAVYLTEKYERYTYPFAIIILTVIGVIVSGRKSRQGTGFQIAFGFALAMIYILFVIISRNMSNIGSMGPLLAAWVPNMIFTVIGFIMYKTMPR